MHDDHHHGHGHSHDHPGNHLHPHAHPGHNRMPPQWQVPHLGEGPAEVADTERDLDLVEITFLEGFGATADPTSFLRLAGIPFVGVDVRGRRLHLLRVEIESLADVGAVVPLLGGTGVHYNPLPAPMVSRRRRLAFVYHDGNGLDRLDFAAARRLSDESAAARFDLADAGWPSPTKGSVTCTSTVQRQP